MFLARRTNLELIWWVVLATVAGWLALMMMYQPAWGDGSRPRTRMSPLDTSIELVCPSWTYGVEQFRQGHFAQANVAFDAAGMELAAAGPPNPTLDAARQLWQELTALALQEADPAMGGWPAYGLTPAGELWHDLAQAAMLLEEGNLRAAEAALMNAWQQEAEHPVVRYLAGLYELETLHCIERGTLGPVEDRLVVHTTAERHARYTGDIHQLTAIIRLEEAIQRAENLDLEEPLVAVLEIVPPTALPTAGDALKAMGAEQFAGRAHHMLGTIYVDRGLPEVAEAHLDAAKFAGIRPVLGYAELGTYYDQLQRPRDAVRAFAKSLQQMPAHGSGAVHMMEGVVRTLRSPWRW